MVREMLSEHIFDAVQLPGNGKEGTYGPMNTKVVYIHNRGGTTYT